MRRRGSDHRGGRVPFLLRVGMLATGVLVVSACAGDGAVSNEASDQDGTASQEASATGDDGGPPSITGRAPSASGGLPAVVTLRPADGETEPATASGSEASGSRGFGGPVVDQFGLAFLPRALVVPVDTPVTFTNSEGSLVHNVHVRSLAGDSTLFNGDAAPGDEITVTLPEAGGYDVLCDMHPGMTAFIYATEAPWATVAEADGRFHLAGVPPGRYLLRVWTADGGLGEPRETSVEEGATTEVDLTPTS